MPDGLGSGPAVGLLAPVPVSPAHESIASFKPPSIGGGRGLQAGTSISGGRIAPRSDCTNASTQTDNACERGIDGGRVTHLAFDEWEPRVFSMTGTRPRAELSGFAYVQKSGLSDRGCGRPACDVAPTAGGEAGPCSCPREGYANRHIRICQCDPTVRGPGGECKFSVRDEDLRVPEPVMVLATGVVALEIVPEGTVMAVSIGEVSGP